MPAFFTPVGAHTQNSSLSSAVEIPTPAGANAIIVQALTQNIRFTLDNTNPTASKGFQLRAGDPAVRLPLPGNAHLRFMEETATAVLQYQFVSQYAVGP